MYTGSTSNTNRRLSNIFAPIDVHACVNWADVAPVAVWSQSLWCGPRVSQHAIYVLNVAPAIPMRHNIPWVASSSTDHIVVSMSDVDADCVHHMGIEHIFPHSTTIICTLRLHLTEHDVSYFETRITVAPFRISPLVDWLESAMVPGRHTRICQRAPCALVFYGMPTVQTIFDCFVPDKSAFELFVWLNTCSVWVVNSCVYSDLVMVTETVTAIRFWWPSTWHWGSLF